MYTEEQLKEVAKRYFIEHQTQEEISKELFCSRSSISRMIHRSMEKGIVKFQLSERIERVGFLEKMMKDRFMLDDVRICRTQQEDISSQLNLLASYTMHELLHDEITIGISFGKSMKQLVKTYKGNPFKNSSIVQIFGLPNNGDEDEEGTKVIDILKKKIGAEGYYLHTPNNIEEVKSVMKLDNVRSVMQTLKKTEDCEYIFTDIYGDKCLHEIKSRYLKKLRKENPDLDIVGTLFGCGIDINGKHVELEAIPELIKRSFHYVMDNSKIILVTSGDEKIKAILGALRGKMINTLITDEKTAYLVYALSELV